jgi:hypothetical protein
MKPGGDIPEIDKRRVFRSRLALRIPAPLLMMSKFTAVMATAQQEENSVDQSPEPGAALCHRAPNRVLAEGAQGDLRGTFAAKGIG